MNTVVTSREAILKVCRDLVAENGVSALNMRAVAQKCNVAIGSIYNYFPSKTELTAATIESVWQDIFHLDLPCESHLSFISDVQSIFRRVNSGIIAYPNFFTAHSVSFARDEKGNARQTMDKYFAHMQRGLLAALDRDKSVRPDAFSEGFTPAQLVDFVLSSLLVLFMQKKQSCAVLIEMISRAIY